MNEKNGPFGMGLTPPQAPLSQESLEFLATCRATGGPDTLFPIKRRALVSIIDELLAYRRAIVKWK